MLCLSTSCTILLKATVKELFGVIADQSYLRRCSPAVWKNPDARIRTLNERRLKETDVSNGSRYCAEQFASMVKQCPGSITPGSSFAVKKISKKNFNTGTKCGLASVVYPRGSVENGPYAVPSEGRTDRMTGISDDFIYGLANAIERSTRPASVNTSLKCNICHLHEVSARFVLSFKKIMKDLIVLWDVSYNISDEESRRSISVITVEVDCYVDVNYIPVLERPTVISLSLDNQLKQNALTRLVYHAKQHY
jgi:hypothetical protein